MGQRSPIRRRPQVDASITVPRPMPLPTLPARSPARPEPEAWRPRSSTGWSARLIEGYASALLDHRRAVEAGELSKPRHRPVDHGALDRMLGRARESLHAASVQRSVGEGSDVRFIGARVHGSALVHQRRVVHLAMFREAG